MKLSDFPPERCRDLIWRIIDRYRTARERWPPHLGLKTQVHLTIEDARLFYAAGQYLKRYSDWNDEAVRSGGKIGVCDLDFSLSFCARWMIDCAAKMDKTDPLLILTQRDMRIVEDAGRHLDHYAMMMSFDKGKKRR